MVEKQFCEIYMFIRQKKPCSVKIFYVCTYRLWEVGLESYIKQTEEVLFWLDG